MWRSDRVLSWLLVLPRLMGIRHYALTLAGVLGVAALIALGPVVSWWLTAVLAWLWLVLPIHQLPWVPWTIRMEIGAPTAADELFPDESDEALEAAYARVQGEVQALVSGR
jgi:hypothetical protein